MAGKCNGIIDKMARNGKAFTLTDDSDVWYSVFDKAQMGTANVGADVEFTFVSKDNGGRTFNNIKGNVKVINPGVGGGTSADASGAVFAGKKTLTFGDISLSRDRCIARQNACNVASNVLKGVLNTKSDVEWVKTALIDLAKVVEDYTTGDLDKAEAEAKLAKPANKATSPQVESNALPTDPPPPSIINSFDEE